MKLHEYNQEIEAALRSLAIDKETGEITGYEAVDQVQADFEDKLESMVCFWKDLQVEISAFKTEEKNLETRRKTLEKRAESLRNYISNCMINAQKDRFSSVKCRVSFRSSKETVIEDESIIPEEYLNVKTVTTSKPDKDKIKKAITEQGLEIPGVRVIEKQNIQIK